MRKTTQNKTCIRNTTVAINVAAFTGFNQNAQSDYCGSNASATGVRNLGPQSGSPRACLLS
jgi:hypothetical protein